MSTPAAPSSAGPSPVPADAHMTRASEGEGEMAGDDLDLEEDIAPNLGGEDQMQDA